MWVKFIGADDLQVNFFGLSDPRGLLHEGRVYEVESKDVHSYHTKLYIKGFPDKAFNSVCFKEVDGPEERSTLRKSAMLSAGSCAALVFTI